MARGSTHNRAGSARAAGTAVVAMLIGLSIPAPSARAAGSTEGSGPYFGMAIGATLYFTAYDGVNGTELWRTDGSAAGTRMVLDIKPGSDGSYPEPLGVVGTTLYLIADDGPHGRELWRTDGTRAGTRLVRDIRRGSGGLGRVAEAWCGQARRIALMNRKWGPLIICS